MPRGRQLFSRLRVRPQTVIPPNERKTVLQPFFFPFLSETGGIVRFATTWQTCPMVVDGQTRRPTETPRRCFWLRRNSAPEGIETVNDMKSMNRVLGLVLRPGL